MRNEQRVHARVRGPFVGRWQRVSMHDSAVTRSSRIADVSVGGCFLESFEAMLSGERLRLDLYLPVVGWMSLSGEVVHFQPERGFGVRFVNLGTDHQDALARAVDHVQANTA